VRHGTRVLFTPCRRKVTYEEGAKFAKDNNLIFLEVSAKTAYQVEDSFKKNAELLLDKIEKGVINMDSEVLPLKFSPQA
jgi:Ras-related protein Rab-2A